MLFNNFSFYLFSEHGSLTIVRRSNSRKDNLLQHQQHPQQSPSEHFNFEPETTIENFNYTNNFENMQSTTVQSVSNEKTPIDATTSYSTITSMTTTTTTVAVIDNIDLATENLPAVDTPDACDKAAVR